MIKRIFSPHPYKAEEILALVRVVTGCMMVYHGWEIFDAAIMKNYEGWEAFSQFSSPSRVIFLGKLAELIGGILLAMGLLTRLAALIIAIVMLYISFNLGDGIIWYKDQHPFLFVLLALIYIFYGGGRYSIDQFLFR